VVKKSTTWTVHEGSFVDGHARSDTTRTRARRLRAGPGRRALGRRTSRDRSERERVVRVRERNGTEGTERARERSTETDGARRARGVTMKPIVGRVVLRVEAKVRRDADATLAIFWFGPGKGPGSFNSQLPGWFVWKKRDERNGMEWNGTRSAR
jgi:hypothetical protein